MGIRDTDTRPIALESAFLMIASNSKIRLGVVPTHLKFIGGLVPDEKGRIPRDGDCIRVVKNLKELCKSSQVRIDTAQISYFPGLYPGDVEEMVSELREIGLNVQFVLMVGGVDPMDPADEDAAVEMLVNGLKTAATHGIEKVSSTSVEEWMKEGAVRKSGDEFDAAVAQNVRVHTRAFHESEIADSSVKAWHIEFLREGEFKTFTDIRRSWTFVSAANKALGNHFFKVLVDAAHCGDSSLSVSENEAVISEIAAAGELGIFHASAKTTRGCLSTDDGWIGALLTACAKTGALEDVFVEVFHHEDEALQALRDLDPGHGVDTTDGRSYNQVVLDGLEDTARRLNNLAARGIL